MNDKKPTIISKETLVPIGLIIVLAGGFFWLGQIAEKVRTLEVKASITPSRDEIQMMQDNIKEIKIDVKQLREDFTKYILPYRVSSTEFNIEN